VRIRLIYWPLLYQWLRPLRPFEAWLYKKLRAPAPLPRPEAVQSPKSKVQS
jgi:hypothetical protein